MKRKITQEAFEALVREWSNTHGTAADVDDREEFWRALVEEAGAGNCALCWEPFPPEGDAGIILWEQWAVVCLECAAHLGVLQRKRLS